MFAIRYSLRTFFGLIVVVSVSIALGTQWRYYDRLETRFIDPGSAEADALLAKPILATSEEIPTATYTANYRDVRWLFSIAQNQVDLEGGLQADFDNDRVILRTTHRSDLKKLIENMAGMDRLEGQHVVIRGLAVDADDRPVAYVPVDLLGPTDLAHQCRTRADGSFSLPVEAQPGVGYALRFRRSYVESYLSMPFSLGEEKREVVLKVVVPEEG